MIAQDPLLLQYVLNLAIFQQVKVWSSRYGINKNDPKGKASDFRKCDPVLFPRTHFWLEGNRNVCRHFLKNPLCPGFCICPMKKPFQSGQLQDVMYSRVQSPRHTHKVCLLPGDLSIQHRWLCDILPRVCKFVKIVSGYFQWNFQKSSRCKYNWCCQHLHSSSTENLKNCKGFRAQS